MSTVQESKIEAHLVSKCAALKLRCLKVRTVGRKGFPDRMIPLGNGRTFFVETKRPVGGALSSAQKREHKRLRAEGYDIAIAWTIAQVDFTVSYIELVR